LLLLLSSLPSWIAIWLLDFLVYPLEGKKVKVVSENTWRVPDYLWETWYCLCFFSPFIV
jgi:hypothetical protein